MCILFVYTNPKPLQGKYQLIIATNRDEYFSRPAAPAHYWPEDKLVIGGKDLEPGREGGTWFGVSFHRSLHFKLRAAALLNVTGEPRKQNAAGRGSIVTDYLTGDLTAEDYIQQCLKENFDCYNAFSFVAVELSDDIPRIIHYSNVTNKTAFYTNVEPKVIGFGNSPPHEPFIKILAGENRLRSEIPDVDNIFHRDLLVRELRDVLQWRQKHLPDPVLERRAPDTVEFLSQLYVDVPMAGYGTRTHTFVLVDDVGNVEFVEETMSATDKSNWIFNNFHHKI